jgi:hypothetical protein
MQLVLPFEIALWMSEDKLFYLIFFAGRTSQGNPAF